MGSPDPGQSFMYSIMSNTVGSPIRAKADSLNVKDTWWCFKIKVAEHDPNGGKSRISSRWLQPSFYIAWSTIDDITLILGIDVPSAVQEIVKNAFNNGSIGQDDPYGWHEFLIRTISELYDFSFWKMRDLVREQVEKVRRQKPSAIQADWRFSEPIYRCDQI